MKELSKNELFQINGGEVSTARKLGRDFGDFLAYCAVVSIFVADAAKDAIKTITKL